MVDQRRYSAFISYAHHDSRWAEWLHHRLETYRIPKGVYNQGGAVDDAGQAPHPLRPIFRDREELSASTQLGDVLQSALRQSDALIIICSPASAKSHWVNEEIRYFRKIHGPTRLFAFIVEGEPYAGDDTECFPAALLEPVEAGGPSLEPLAADGRPQGDGKRHALLKLVAGLLDVGLDRLVQRDVVRRQRRLRAITGASLTGMVGALSLALYAENQRRIAVDQRALAVRNERMADATVDYLVDTFAIANPATENPNTITARTILERGAAGIETELADEPQIQARLYGAIGRIYRNLGLFDQSQNMLEAGYARLDGISESAVSNRLDLAATKFLTSDFDAALSLTGEALQQLKSEENPAVPLMAYAHELRGSIFKLQLKFDDAIAQYETAMALYAQADDDQLSEIARVNVTLGGMLTLLERYDEADERLTAAYDYYAEKFGANHIDAARVLNNLAYLSMMSGDLATADERSANVIAVYERVLDDSHPDLATIRLMRGQILEAEGDLAGAAGAFRAALSAYEAAYPQGHYETGFACVHLALVLSQQGQTDEALALMDRAWTEYDAGYGGLHANHGDLEVNRAVILARAERDEDAAQACQEGMGILNETLGPESPPTLALREQCVAIGALPPQAALDLPISPN
ncbi:toll/interleukin-1 receptor domain-containing protein [Parvularcula sp. LCG005]|uniref:tetratricopeptide repeat protein n=1 Tax=Parvularcula sp. LCG005 TaxID=3078805 RepID=UPI0029426883|nr:toll/interleukin-1 receptor domain-containing protein [Parvularcula sp. LCG005]WOI52917.1 toll/interleukin-1 receptor domain-containing protein [Parvularcula sp. LCG005]